MSSGYDEKTYVHPQSRSEVYGQDGYGWYCDKETAELHFPTIKLEPNLNPLWFTLTGMTAAKIRNRGFIK